MTKIFTIFATFIAISFSAHAEEAKDWQKGKERILSKIEKRITSLNELKTCVSNSSDKATMKECRKKHRSAMKEAKKASKKK